MLDKTNTINGGRAKKTKKNRKAGNRKNANAFKKYGQTMPRYNR